jgi:hypothetical protein
MSQKCLGKSVLALDICEIKSQPLHSIGAYLELATVKNGIQSMQADIGSRESP